MLKNYLTAALRHLVKKKTYTLLNALGLSVGLACFTLIGLWVKHELSYDRFHTKADRIYRIGGYFTDGSGKFDQAVTPPPLGPALMSDFPEIEESIRIDKNDATVQLGDKQFIEDDILLVDPSFLSVFDFPLLSGDAKTALVDPYSIVLSETMAKKYFGNADPVGKSIKVFMYDPDGKGKEYKITGVVSDCPLNSQFRYNLLVSFKTMEVNNPDALTGDGWYWNGYYTYFLLREGNDPKNLEAKLPQLIEKYMGKTNREWKIGYEYFLQPFTSIHLNSHLRYEIAPTSSTTYVFIFGSIGVLVLLLACINYVNLSTSYSADRFKDVGVRKVMGAVRRQLIGQYLSESWMLALASLFLAFVWIEVARPLFESLTDKPVTGLYNLPTLSVLFLVASFVGLCSGIYPAVMLSSFRPVNILKGTFRTGSSGVWLRKGLVVFQYAVTIVLVIGILVVQLQFRFIQSKDLGYDQNHLIVLGVNGSQEVMGGYSAFARELESTSVTSGAARSNSSITGGLGNSVAEMENASGQLTNATVYRLRVDFDYLNVYKMQLVAGRFLSPEFPSDSAKGYVVNEELVRTYGYVNPADAVGKKFVFGGNEGEVVGVVKNFHYNSLQHKVEPTCMFLLRNNFSRITLRVNGTPGDALAKVSGMWNQHFPNSVLDFDFAEDALAAQYGSEQRFSRVFLVFSGISLGVACLGLFALVSFAVESRTKEIGIRKVLGATVPQILGMLSREFLLLILVSSLLAVPLGYYIMKQWLSGFAYQMEINPLLSLIAVAFVLVIAWATVTLRSTSAARANPVDSLRSE